MAVTPTPSPTPIPKELLPELRIGQTIQFGHYEQDGDTENGEEAIEWQVLDIRNGNALIISRNALAASKFKSSASGAKWETSQIREWLNGEFIETVFTQDERNAIQTTLIDNYLNDDIFLLSAEEAETYFADDSARIVSPTAAIVRNVNIQNGACGWWLRSSNEKDEERAMFVDYKGAINTKGKAVYSKGIGARPAMWINASEAGFKVVQGVNAGAEIGDIVQFGTYEQDGDLSTGKEPIEWLVVASEGREVTLLSRYLLDVQPYNEDGAAAWADSSLRTWLNEVFYRTAFSKDEREGVLEADGDVVTIPSSDDINRYFPDTESRIAKPTVYASQNIDAANWWWLKDNGEGMRTAMVVTDQGAISTSGDEVNFGGDGIRPMITVDMSVLVPNGETSDSASVSQSSSSVIVKNIVSGVYYGYYSAPNPFMWSYDSKEKTLTIGANADGEIRLLALNGVVPWRPYVAQIEKIVFAPGIVSISSGYLKDAVNLKEVVVPDTAIEIDDSIVKFQKEHQ